MENIPQKSKSTDCLECRLVSGLGIIGIGCYVYAQASKQNTGRSVMKILSAGMLGLGIARLLNVSFHKARAKS